MDMLLRAPSVLLIAVGTWLLGCASGGARLRDDFEDDDDGSTGSGESPAPAKVEVLAKSQNFPGDIAIHDGAVYWLNEGSTTVGGGA